MKVSRWVVIAALLLVSLTPRTADAHVGWWDWLDAFSGPGPFDQKGLDFDIRFYCGFDSDNQFVVPTEVESVITPASTGIYAEGDREAAKRLLGTGWVPLFGRRDVRDFKAIPEKPGQYQPVHQATTEGKDALQKPLACFRYSDAADHWIELRYGRVGTISKPLFDDVPGEFVGKLTAHSLQGSLMRRVDPVLAIGGGAGVLWFSGKTTVGETPMLTGHAARLFVTPVSVMFTPLKVIPASMFPSHRVQALLSVFNVRMELVLVGGSKAADFNKNSTSRFKSGRELLTNIAFSFDFSPLINVISPVKF